jgi:endonuclease G
MKKLLLLFISLKVSAGDTLCPHTDFNPLYAPTAANEVIYCYKQYELAYDFGNKSAIWVGEHLSINEQFFKDRKNSFHANMDIPEPSRTTPKDYAEPNYDQGHMAPSGDMVDEESQHESFLMSNMVPQTPQLNRVIWRKLEDHLRKQSKTSDLYVITGPLYEGTIIHIGNSVPVPSSTFKWIYNTTTHEQFGYIIPNQKQFNDLETYRVSKVELEKRAKIFLK